MLNLQLITQILFILFCIDIAVQIFYYLYFFTRLAYHKIPQETEEENINLPMSIIVCARDEATKLAQNLPGVLVQHHKANTEVIIVNDNSVDETKYILDEFKKSFNNINHIELRQEAMLISGKKFPLSVGIKSAKYETLLLTDADCVPASEFWVDKMQAAYANSNIEIVLGYGAYHKKAGLLNKLIRFETYHTALQYFSYALAGVPYMGIGRNLSYKRDVFIRNKGFASINNILSGDDDLFINKIANKTNTAIVIDKDAHTLSEPKKTWGSWIKQKSRHYTTSKYYKPLHKFLLSWYSLSLFLVYPLLVLSIIFFNWWLVLAVFAVRFFIQLSVHTKAMKKLNEADLIPHFLLLDVWMFFYYILFFFALFKRPSKTWK